MKAYRPVYGAESDQPVALLEVPMTETPKPERRSRKQIAADEKGMEAITEIVCQASVGSGLAELREAMYKITDVLVAAGRL